MNSPNNLEDSNDYKTTFIDKLLDEMKSEFNKNVKVEKNSDEIELDTIDDLPPNLTAEIDNNIDNNNCDTDILPPKITKIDSSPSKTSDSSTSSESKSICNQNIKGGKSQGKIKANIADTDIPSKSESTSDSNTETDTKPRIVLTFRTKKSKSVVTSSYAEKDKDTSAEESMSPGRRSLRNKTNISEEKKTEMETGLKRSARRRSKDCTESILQSAIARKEKSYNETSRPQRLTRRLKPTAKILANLEMCQKNFKTDKNRQIETKSKSSLTLNKNASDRQRFSYEKVEKGSEQAILESDTDYMKRDESTTKISAEQLQPKIKRKHKHKASKLVAKKSKIKSEENSRDTDTDSSTSSHQETETDKELPQDDKSVKSEPRKSPRKSSSDTDNVKPFRRSHRKSGRQQEVEDRTDNAEIFEPLSGSVAEEENVSPADPESTSVTDIQAATIKKCLCQQTSQIYMSTSNSSDVVYCTALDSVNNRIIGCNNVVLGEIAMLRPSTRIPYIILCEVHKQRLLRHNCCPTCGLFCTQGRFIQCEANHTYHTDCQILLDDLKYCPHCGLQTPNYDVEITMKCTKNPVFLPMQKSHYPSAKMSFHTKSNTKKEQTVENRSPSPPLIPINILELMKSTELPEPREKFQFSNLYDAIKANDCEKVAIILGSKDVNLSETISVNDELPLLHYASQEGLLAIVHMLLIAGAEKDLFDKEQNTPLTLAILFFQNAIVKYLIKSGASITLKGTDGMSALHLAAKSGNLEACEYLLLATKTIQSYINCIDDGGWTPLVWACEHGHVNVTRFLLQNGADPFLRDVEQNIALHWAAFSGTSQISEMLLNHGCDVNAVNAHGDSPLHVAARQDRYNCVLILLARGANVHLTNKSGEMPLNCCLSQSSDCYTAISLNLQLQAVTGNGTQRKQIILTNDISRGKEINPVQCLNTIDDESKPIDFTYVIENCITSDINIDRKITMLQSCRCEDRCTTSDCLCSNNSLRCWYTEEGRLSVDFNYADPPMLFECNPACSCNAITCNNRVVQHGLTQRFQLFRTLNKGWGIKTLKTIAKGTYVCEYIGEIISDLEADQREDDSYLFDLDNRDGETYCIDARRYGNLSRFINHSCDPNLLPVRIYIDHQDLRFPRIAFFANRDIQVNEELGFDYGEKFWIIKYKSFTCTCGYPMCRYSAITIKTTLENYQKRLSEEQATVPDI